MEEQFQIKPLASFLAITFGGGAVLALIASATGGRSSALTGVLAPLAMLLPAFGVLFVRVVFRAGLADAGCRRFPVRWLPVALLALPFAIHALTLPGTMALEGRLPWAPWLHPAPDGLFHTPPERGWGVLTANDLAGRIALNLVAGLLAVSALAFFEEIGWRVWLLPRLVTRFGKRQGMVASAAIWAAWHIPYTLSGIQFIENVSLPAVLALTPLGHIGAGLFLAWLWMRTRSIAMVSLAHGSLNNWGQYAFKFMITSGPSDAVLLALVNTTLLAAGVAVLSLRWGNSPAEM